MWVIIAVVLVIWYFTARGKAREKQELLALRRFARRITDGERRDWTADFVDMALAVKRYDSNGIPEGSEPMFYLLRRHDGQWEMRLSDASREAEAFRLEQEIKRGDGGSVLAASRIEDQKRALVDLQESKWVAIDGEIAGPLESQYQRFIAHYPAN